MHAFDVEFSHMPERNIPVSGASGAEKLRNFFSGTLGKRVDITLNNPENLLVLKDGGILAVAPHNGHADSGVVRWAVHQMVEGVHTKHRLHHQLERPPRISRSSQEKRQAAFDALPEAYLDISPEEADRILRNLIILAAADYWFPNPSDPAHKRAWNFLRSVFASMFIRILPITRRRQGTGKNALQKSMEDLHRIADLINNSGVVTIFPEGTRSRNPDVPLSERKFQSGIGLLAAFTGVTKPIVPMVLENAAGIWPPNQTLPNLKRTPVTVTVGKPIHTESLISDTTELSDEELRTIRQQITSLVRAYFRSFDADQSHQDDNLLEGEMY